MEITPATQQDQSLNRHLTFRWATAKGDLVMVWKDNRISIDGRLSTKKEQQLVKEWAKKNKFLVVGSLDAQASILVEVGKEKEFRKALTRLIRRSIGEAGYMVYAVDKRGGGRVLYANDDYEPVIGDDVEEVAKVPATKGG